MGENLQYFFFFGGGFGYNAFNTWICLVENSIFNIFQRK